VEALRDALLCRHPTFLDRAWSHVGPAGRLVDPEERGRRAFSLPLYGPERFRLGTEDCICTQEGSQTSLILGALICERYSTPRGLRNREAVSPEGSPKYGLGASTTKGWIQGVLSGRRVEINSGARSSP